jgi:S-methylmethionine-dependent homocysteine/selenocysteine methylase/SAM-dependent methyltransferase
MSVAGLDAWPAYAAVDRMLAGGRCVVLDGGVGTELAAGWEAPAGFDDRAWGCRALLDGLDAVRDVHRRYVEAGCHVISTNTWGLPSAVLRGAHFWEASEPVHWMEVARRGTRVARQAIAAAGRSDECAVAFSVNGDLDVEGGQETIRLLGRAFEREAPDLVLVETLSVVRPSLYDTVATLLDLGLPVWLSFRRCRHGLCSVYGQHWGGPEGDAFGRAARRFEEMGVAALLVNCTPPDHVAGMVSYLRDFTDLPLGVSPNLGYHTTAGWRSDQDIGGAQYAELALGWREEGAQIVGGCCGVSPEHIAAAAGSLAGTVAGTRRAHEERRAEQDAPEPPPAQPWADRRGRRIHPIAFPAHECEAGVIEPDEGTLMVWQHVVAEDVGAHQRCLDVGSGTGLLTTQLALNGAQHVHAIDIDERAVANTLNNAFRNGVANRVSATTTDLRPWVPEERYDVVVACLPQAPQDPYQQVTTHMDGDYWGRNLLDQVIGKLPAALAVDGVAYVVHLSTVPQATTTAMLARCGLTATVADHRPYRLPASLVQAAPQVARVEELSDAYHLQLGATAMVVAYLLEIRAAA